MPKARESFDEVAWDKNDEAWDESRNKLRLKSTCRQVEALAEKAVGKTSASLVSPIFFGGFNVLYRIKFKHDSSDVIVRLPCPDLVQFPKEKTLYEAAAMAYLTQNTTIPVLTLFYHTSSSDVGPALVLQHIESVRDMSDAFAIPNEDPEETPVLNPDIEEGKLRKLYQRIAVIVLELYKPTFPRIGSLTQVEKGRYEVSGRPITQNMNNMIQLANIPRSVLPENTRTFASDGCWYTALAEMHMAQLLFQHNDLIRSEDDCRNKHIARILFHTLAKQGRLSIFGFVDDFWSAQANGFKLTCPAPNGSGRFRLWCDDFRPVNILVDQEDDIIAAIDWEFTYVAPEQFSLDPPWWLLLEAPEMWPKGIDDWAETYNKRLETWLLALEDTEKSSNDESEYKLSSYMRESWLSGRFWLNYAARKSWAFDTIYWKFLDERFFGPREAVEEDSYWKTRVQFLGEEGERKMESFVQRKMTEVKERVLVNWDPAAAKDLLAKTLGDGDHR
ncbi:hypothetical protein ACHAPO_010478 [Fusarium lateritium]